MNSAYKLVHSKLWLTTENPVCHYCDITLTLDNASRDHKVPISKGGKKMPHDNIVLSCCKCNRRKGDVSYEDYMASPALAKRRIGVEAAKKNP